METAHLPPPGSKEEDAAFARIQERFPSIYRDIFSDPKAPRTVVVMPSMSLDERELAKIEGVIHYEERMLCLLMLLRLPRTQLIYVTSVPLNPAVIDYYLHLLPGIPGAHARERLQLITVDDSSLTPLSKKILDRPDVLAELERSIAFPGAAHMACFNTTALEKTLAVQLGIPIYGCDPALAYLGNKTMSRKIFKDVGLEVPDGFEGLRDEGDIVEALVALHQRNPRTSEAVLKLNDGFSGEGNAVVPLATLEEAAFPEKEARRILRSGIRFEARDENWESYLEKFDTMEGILEVMIEADHKESPSVQLRINPLGEVNLVSTHDQVLSGPSGQIFQGCSFPADREYRIHLHRAGMAVGEELRDRGVLGRIGVDFVSVPEADSWRNYAIEINIRKGGTTLPYLMLEFLTDGSYDPSSGLFFTPTGDSRSYYATDNLVRESYRGLYPKQLIDSAVLESLHYHAASQRGLVFHMLGAVTDFGKIGVLSIAPSIKEARRQYEAAVQTLDAATADRVS
jgi:hypothetical protein